MKEIESRLGEVEFKLDGIEGNVGKILDLLAGNKLNKNDGGILGDINDLRKRVAELERFKDRIIYVVIGLSLAGGWGMADIIGKLFSHK